MALNPVIKFTTLFGLLAVELAVQLTVTQGSNLTHLLGGGVLCRVVLLRVPLVLRHAHRGGSEAAGSSQRETSSAQVYFVGVGCGRPRLLLSSVRMYRTSCQRCSSGNRLNDGIPFPALPLVIFQNSVPSLCS